VEPKGGPAPAPAPEPRKSFHHPTPVPISDQQAAEQPAAAADPPGPAGRKLVAVWSPSGRRLTGTRSEGQLPTATQPAEETQAAASSRRVGGGARAGQALGDEGTREAFCSSRETSTESQVASRGRVCHCFVLSLFRFVIISFVIVSFVIVSFVIVSSVHISACTAATVYNFQHVPMEVGT
jgi:hypothetical protein